MTPDPRPCADCGEPILWLRTIHGRRMPVDARPNRKRGNVAVDRRRATVLGRDQAAAARASGRRLHTHHRVSCPYAHRWARPAHRQRR